MGVIIPLRSRNMSPRLSRLLCTVFGRVTHKEVVNYSVSSFSLLFSGRIMVFVVQTGSMPVWLGPQLLH